MKKLFVLRFGNTVITDFENYLSSIPNSYCEYKIFGNIGVVTLFETEMTAEELSELLNNKFCNNIYSEFFIYIVFDLQSKDTGHNLFNLGKGVKIDIETFINRQKCTLSLDELLSKIYKEGINSLTKDEKERLDQLSKNI